MEFTIRAATLEDCKDISRMILELAEYEKVSDQVKIAKRDLEQDGFSKNPFFHGIIAEVPEHLKSKEGEKKEIGILIQYSSWINNPIKNNLLWWKGIGKALMSKVSQLGLAAGCTQLNFTVLDWNKSSLDFYLKQGCWDVTSDLGYHCMRCEGDALEHLAQGGL
uniref:Spermidine/spermine N1-acetyltransferase family member 2a n=1 Tax=Cyprinus carpio TaxID=7962 RepID=A0A8C2EG39_CYPCA